MNNNYLNWPIAYEQSPSLSGDHVTGECELNTINYTFLLAEEAARTAATVIRFMITTKSALSLEIISPNSKRNPIPGHSFYFIFFLFRWISIEISLGEHFMPQINTVEGEKPLHLQFKQWTFVWFQINIWITKRKLILCFTLDFFHSLN